MLERRSGIRRILSGLLRSGDSWLCGLTAAPWSKAADWEKIMVNAEGYVMQGHHRIAAAKAGVEIPESAIIRTSMQNHRPAYTWMQTLGLE